VGHPAGAQRHRRARRRRDRLKFLLRDRDSKYTASFDEVFRAQGARIVKSPFRAPNANSHAERFVRSVRRECLDHLLIMNERHLERVLRTYVRHYNRHRPHQGISEQAPTLVSTDRCTTVPSESHHGRLMTRLARRDRLGRLIHDYEVAA
jgi:transposase InsO family protein